MAIRLFARLVDHVSSQQKGTMKSYAKSSSGGGGGGGASGGGVDNILFSAL